MSCWLAMDGSILVLVCSAVSKCGEASILSLQIRHSKTKDGKSVLTFPCLRSRGLVLEIIKGQLKGQRKSAA